MSDLAFWLAPDWSGGRDTPFWMLPPLRPPVVDQAQRSDMPVIYGRSRIAGNLVHIVVRQDDGEISPAYRCDASCLLRMVYDAARRNARCP